MFRRLMVIIAETGVSSPQDDWARQHSRNYITLREIVFLTLSLCFRIYRVFQLKRITRKPILKVFFVSRVTLFLSLKKKKRLGSERIPATTLCFEKSCF